MSQNQGDAVPVPAGLSSVAPAPDDVPMLQLAALRTGVECVGRVYEYGASSGVVSGGCARGIAAIDAAMHSPSWPIGVAGALVRAGQVQMPPSVRDDERAALVALQGLTGLAAVIVQDWRHAHGR